MRISKQKRQCWVVPSGMGKSRVIAVIATILLKAFRKELKTIVIAFSSQVLLNTDQTVYQDLERII